MSPRFIAEPVVGAGGVHAPPDGYLARVASICEERDVLFIADEVITGFGRTGEMFACERHGIAPDVLLLAKGLTSGYLPLGAAVFSGRIVEPFEGQAGPWLRHGYTYSGHATACAAALANLGILEAESLVEHVGKLEDSFAVRVKQLERLAGVAEVRTVGLTAAVQLDTSWSDPALAGRKISTACRQRGVLTRVLAGNALQVSPPFVISSSEQDELVNAIGEAVGAIGKSK